MALSRLSLRELQSRPARSLLTLLSIIIGAGAIVATYIASDSARLAQRAMVQNVTGNAQLEIQAAGGGSVDIRAVLFLKEIPGISVISPSVRRCSFLGSISMRTARFAMWILSLERILMRPLRSTFKTNREPRPLCRRFGATKALPNPRS